MNPIPSKDKLSHIKQFLKVVGSLLSAYMAIIITIGFLVPWIVGAIKIHNYNEIIGFIEVFVLVSATLSLLSFTYIMALSDIHEKVKDSIIKSGELFFMATVQFIVGLFLLLTMDYFTSNFLNISNINLNFNLQGITSIIIFIIQIIIFSELIFAISKFFKGVIEIYMSFRSEHFKESIFYILYWRDRNV
ncbi:MAG: hypothetical protein PHY59_01080 [Methanobacterium sp.]|nr:hypothetical protein [Methanobacterium sp.]